MRIGKDVKVAVEMRRASGFNVRVPGEESILTALFHSCVRWARGKIAALSYRRSRRPCVQFPMSECPHTLQPCCCFPSSTNTESRHPDRYVQSVRHRYETRSEPMARMGHAAQNDSSQGEEKIASALHLLLISANRANTNTVKRHPAKTELDRSCQTDGTNASICATTPLRSVMESDQEIFQ